MNIKNIATSGLLAASLVVPGVVLAAPDIVVKYIVVESTPNVLPTISEDGRYMAYRLAQKVVSGTPPTDIMVRDMVTGVEVQANLMVTGGAPTNATCAMPALSRNGRFVSFGCRTPAMGAYAQKGTAYFVYDRINNKTEMIPDLGEDFVSIEVPTAISADGRFVAFLTVRAPNQYTLFVRDIVNKTTTATVAQSTTVAVVPSPMSISADGRYITYIAKPTPSIAAGEVYVHDRVTGATEVVNVKPNGTRSTQAGHQVSASDDATVVAFTSTDGELVNPRGPTTSAVYVRDRKTGVTELVSPRTASGAGNSTISGNGRYVAYIMSDTVYVYDRLTKTTRNIVAPKVRSIYYPRMSGDGRYVVVSGLDSGGAGGAIVVADMGIAAGVSLSSRELTLTEGGIAATYSMSLTQAPNADVKISIGTGAQLSLARTELVFTPENWSVPQVVSVQAVADGVSEGRHTTTIVHTVTSTDANYAVVEPANVGVTITDGVIPTIILPAATWNRSDMPLTGTAAPGATVMLTAVNRTTGWMSSVSTVANAQGQWSYTMTGFTDGIVDLDAQAEGIRSAVQTVTVKLVVVPPTPTFTDVTGYIRTTAYGLILNRATGKYAGNFVLTNTGSIPLKGPLHLQLDNLTAGVTLFNATGSHDGAPYITVPAGLAPDESVTIPLLVTNPAKVTVSYDAKIFSGTF